MVKFEYFNETKEYVSDVSRMTLDELQCIEQSFGFLYLTKETNELVLKPYQVLKTEDIFIERYDNVHSLEKCISSFIFNLDYYRNNLTKEEIKSIENNYPEFLI